MTYYTVPSDVRIAFDDHSAVLLDLRNGKFYSVSSVGALILQRLLERKSVSEIASYLETRYGKTRSEIDGDLRSFLSDLIKKGLCHEGKGETGLR
jgi:hypothetical protein